MKLAIVLARRRDAALASALTAAALRAGDEVRWFAMAEGVLALPLLGEGAAAGPGAEVEVIACATSVDQLTGQLAKTMPAWVILGSQDDHAALVAWADRTVALT